MALFRKLLGNSQDGHPKGTNAKSTASHGLQPIGVQLQRKFAKGVQYNMKIVIRGDRNVGKTCLFYRLQGQKFHEEYIPTEEIQVCCIHWNYKATDDIVKVDVWDIVDKGKKKTKSDGLKLDNSPEPESEEPCLDADFLDVYKGTHGVILVYDITKQWTFSYVEREIEKISPHIPILVLGNHRDMGHHRTVLEDKARFFCSHLERQENAADIRYAESSMRNGFGLKYLHKFFNLPFLQLQKETLLKQLEINTEEMASTVEELNIHEESEEQNYDIFIDNLCQKRRQQQEVLSDKSALDITMKQSDIAPVLTDSREITKPASLPVPKSISMPSLQKSVMTSKETASVCNTPTQSNNKTDPPTITPTELQPSSQQPEQKSGFFSRLFKSKDKETTSQKKEPIDLQSVTRSGMVKSVEDFVPDDGGLDSSFLDDARELKDNSAKQTFPGESDSDEDGVNPMVAGFQDGIDSEDEIASPVKDFSSSDNMAVKQNEELSSDEDKITVPPVKDFSSLNNSAVQQSVEPSSDEDELTSKTAYNKKVVKNTLSDKKLNASDTKETLKHSRGNTKVQVECLSDSDKLNISSDLKVENSMKGRTKSLSSNSGSSEMGSKAESSSSDNAHVGKVTMTISNISDSEEDNNELSSQFIVAQDVDISDEELNTGKQEEFSDWLDQQEDKSSLKDKVSVPSDEEVQKLPVIRNKKKSSSRLSSSVIDNSADKDVTSGKKKKKKKKDREKEEEASGKKYKKKDKQKGEEKDGLKKKKKKESGDVTNDNDMDDLEAFLNDDPVVPASDGHGYESL